MASTVLSQSKSDVYTAITAKIIAAIEAGTGTFQMPWHGGLVPPAFPENAATGKPYRGGNVVALWVEAQVRRYISGYWASYLQWKNLGAQVRKGERGALILFYKPLEQGEDTEDETDEAKHRFVARASYMFNSEQVDGWNPPERPVKSEVQINAEVAAFVAALDVDIRHGSSVARYRHDLDCIEMPNPEAFIGTSTSSPTESYHAVLFHELVHLSGAPHRLNREFGRRFGDRAYAFEEIVGELGAAFLCSAFRIANEPRDDHAAYVSSWLEILNRDVRAIFTAASKAQEACEYLLNRASANATQQ
jgi:antirestriction protein ArdC